MPKGSTLRAMRIMLEKGLGEDYTRAQEEQLERIKEARRQVLYSARFFGTEQDAV